MHRQARRPHPQPRLAPARAAPRLLAALGRLIQRRPVWAALGATALLLLLAAPALGLRLGESTAGNDPAKLTTRRAYDLLATGFGRGFNGPLLVAVRPPERRRRRRRHPLHEHAPPNARGRIRRSAAAEPCQRRRRNRRLPVYPTTSPQSAKTTSLVKRLRAHVHPPRTIDAFIPMMVFAIVFGLSMDCEVFLVSRIHEEWQHRGDASAAVREGLATPDPSSPPPQRS